jgi:5'-3' exonuclease
MQITIVELKGYEADDVIGTLAVQQTPMSLRFI